MARKTRGSLVLSPSLSLARAVLLSLSPTFRPFPPPAHSFYPRRSSAATISSPFPFFLSFFFREASSSFPSFVSLLSLLSPPPPYSSSLSLPFSRRSPPSPLPSRAVREQAGSNPYGTSLSSHSSSRFFLSPPIPLLFHLPRGVANLILRYIYFRNDPALYIYIYIFSTVNFFFFLSFFQSDTRLFRKEEKKNPVPLFERGPRSATTRITDEEDDVHTHTRHGRSSLSRLSQ